MTLAFAFEPAGSAAVNHFDARSAVLLFFASCRFSLQLLLLLRFFLCGCKRLRSIFGIHERLGSELLLGSGPLSPPLYHLPLSPYGFTNILGSSGLVKLFCFGSTLCLATFLGGSFLFLLSDFF